MTKKSTVKSAGNKETAPGKPGREKKGKNQAEGVEEIEKKDEPKQEIISEPTAEEKLKEFQDKYLRLSAEFDNYRKRTMKEKADLLKSAGESTIIRFIPVMDDFERAMTSLEKATDLEAVKKGIELIFNKLRETLQQQGIREIESLHREFDTDLHEAVTKIPAPDEKLKGLIVDVIEKGYYLNDKVIRFSKVVIGE